MKHIFTVLLVFISLVSNAQWIDKILSYENKLSLKENKVSRIEVWYYGKKIEQLLETIFLDTDGEVVERRFIFNNDTTDFDFELRSYDINTNTSVIKQVHKSRHGCFFGDGPPPTKKIIRTNSDGKVILETSYWKIKDRFAKTIKQRYIRKYHYDTRGLLVMIEGISKKKPESIYKLKYY